jgi:signal transduction histidine kinase/HPt (histidine-containing phosphotransfer) domain-containing protein/ActR/RegA family two-component response regulator
MMEICLFNEEQHFVTMNSFAVPLRRSIRFRLSLVIAVVIFAAVMSASTAGAFRDLSRAADARAEMIEAAASAYSAAVADPLAAKDRRAALDYMRGMRDLRSVIFMALEDQDGGVLAQLGAGASVRGKTANLRALAGLDLLNADRGSVAMPVIKGGVQIGQLYILADITDLRAELFATLGWTAVIGFIAIVGGVAVAQFSIGRITKPIHELAAVMAEVGAKQDFSHRVEPSKRRDETGVLGEAFNGMIDNIHERDRRIAHHMETLEQTVEDRTYDLRLAKEDAEAANAAKSDFLATMSHEIRTPMHGMMVMAEMLAAADLSSRHRRYAEIITRSGASLLTIINDILDLSKIEAGKLDLEAVPFSPESMVEDVASLFWEKARSKGLELAIRIAPDVPAMVIGDPTRLNQIVTNLVNNALKFTETGGVTIDVTAEPDSDRARLGFAVTDTGVGIEASRIGAIFEAFSQADQSTTRRFGGTGLGLTVCKRLVDAMGGDILVTSEPGKGSTFTVIASLPVEAAAPAKPEASGLRVALALNAPLLTRCLLAAFRDVGISPRTIASPQMAAAGETVLTLSDLLAKHGGAPGAQNICLTDIGDSHSDGLIRDRTAVDLLPLPLGRLALWDFVARASRQEFRGPAALALSSATSPTETFGHLSILAVDDNAVNRVVLREALLSLGAEGDFVSNGVEAVGAASKKTYDVIFMDGSMPEMDGFTATKLIRDAEAKAGSRRTFVVALTAQVRGADADAWAAAGADRHMTKPFTSARLLDALKSAGSGGVPSAARPTPSAPIWPEPPRETPLIDDEAVATMEAVGARSGRDVVAKVWKLFLGQAPDAAFKLETLAAGSDPATLVKQAHFLKSMCLAAGAARLAVLCGDVEHQAAAGQINSARKTLEGLRWQLDQTCAEMTARLAGRAAAAS